jgi:hypothetical protein
MRTGKTAGQVWEDILMSHIQEGESGPSAVERAEELVNHAGQRLGLFAALAGVRVLQTTLALSERMIRQRIAQLSQTEKGSTKQQEQPRSTPATNHTEQLVERMGQQLGSFTALASRSVLSAGTRIREEAKDIWTEAQAPHHEKDSSPHS